MVLASEEGLTVFDFELAKQASEWIEVAAIVVILVAVVLACVQGLRVVPGHGAAVGFAAFKSYLSRGVLIGLDLLIAADIIRTVTIAPTIENVAGLGLLVLIRTVLAWTLVLEAEGRWPWQLEPPPLP